MEAETYRKSGTPVAQAQQNAVQRGANDDAIFILSVPVRYPEQKTGCSDLPKQPFRDLFELAFKSYRSSIGHVSAKFLTYE